MINIRMRLLTVCLDAVTPDRAASTLRWRLQHVTEDELTRISRPTREEASNRA